MPSLTEQIDRALSDGKLRADAAENIRRILSGEESDFAVRVIGELSQANEWEELNDRFYKTLAFGTGGLRGRTIAKIVTPSERGTPTALGRPEFPCVGTNAMNYFNVGRATRGLVIYIQKWRSGQRVEGRAKIVIAHDTRHFSQEFTRLAAETASANGCDAVVFDGIDGFLHELVGIEQLVRFFRNQDLMGIRDGQPPRLGLAAELAKNIADRDRTHLRARHARDLEHRHSAG